MNVPDSYARTATYTILSRRTRLSFALLLKGTDMYILNPVELVFLLYPLFLIGFFLGAPIIGFVYIRADADQSGQPGWLWALATIFLSWLAVLAYLIVRALSSGQPRVFR